jgi:hypothetical protein
LDAIVISSLFKRPVYSLARGDVFKNKFVARMLRSLKMLPVYRSSEGVQNMEHNYSTFSACKEIFKKNGIVLIFSEGRCINEWKLRPLMKGTARLAISSWEEGIDLKILPTGINYQSFTVFGKNIQLNFGEMITRAESLASFNHILYSRLQPLVYEIDKKDVKTLHEKFAIPVAGYAKILLAVPAVAGYVLHFPLTYPAKKLAAKFGGHNDHYDSMLVGMLFIAYPLYLLLVAIVFYKIDHHYWWMALLILPASGYSYMHIKKQF